MRRSAIGLVAFALLVRAAAANDSFFYTDTSSLLLKEGVAVVDSRAIEVCQKRSFEGARCLSPATFLGPHRRLAALPDILWVLGAAGLTGEETAMVVGDEPTARDFVAGLLYLVGQRRVAILRAPVGQGVEPSSGSFGPGMARGMTREKVFQTPVRDDLWILRRELAAWLAGDSPPMLLDGRGESEFWGETVRAARGGHLPGGESLPASVVRAALARNEVIGSLAGEPVAYAHDVVEGIAFFALLRAGAGVSARVYPGGWAEWAADGSLPADAATYPDRAGSMAVAAPSPMTPAWPVFLAVALLGGALAAGGFYLGRRGLGGGAA